MDFKKPQPRPRARVQSGAMRPRPEPVDLPRAQGPTSSLKQDIDDALNAIDRESETPPVRNYVTRRTDRPKTKRERKPWSRKRKVITGIAGFFAILALIAGFYVFRIAKNTTGIFDGNVFDVLFKQDKLKTDQYGRSNILIFGTSEDDPGHSGSQLADSIMVLSIDQKTKEAYTVSIPRDLWVNYSTPCGLGSEGKINATYTCALQNKNGDEDAASMAFAAKVSEVIGTDVQYYVAVNYSVVRGLVNSLGGVEVNIKSDDPRGIYDAATKLKLSNGKHVIDGETALQLSRARGSHGGYGLAQSNFDREKNQQEVLRAVQDKALQSGTLLDPNKVVGLTESLGKNVRTNVRSSELQTALSVAAGIQSSSIVSKPLNDPANRLVTTGRHGNQSIVRPVKGLTDYSDIHAYLRPTQSGNAQ